ncbi:MAG: ABC transporter permease [Candidatus Moranbacteria bacterium]|nr:ABC transporter permease [Candidatus Moranbacteria bacterium]
MNSEKIWIAYKTIVRAEVVRFFRIWSQTFLPPAITTTLYYVIFGTFIGSQIDPIGDFTYMQFIVPGLVMMAVITSSFTNTVSSFFGAKFQRQLEELLVAPVPPVVVVAGYVTGGVIRGLLTGLLVLIIALFFTHITIFSWFAVGVFILLTSIMFSLLGLVTAIFAKNFDGVQIIPNFVLTPLTYLGGVFYSIHMLSPFWQGVSKLNPILYMVNGFRYGFLGMSDVHVGASLCMLVLMSIALVVYTMHLFRTGRGLRH